jgi:adenylate cyclase
MADLDDLLSGVGEGSLELAVLERLLQPDPPDLDLDALAARAGITGPQMHQLWRAMGFPDPLPGESVAGAADLDILQWAGDRLHDPVQFDRTLQLLRITASSLARMAETAADDIADRLADGRQAGMSSREMAGALVDEVDLPAIGRVVFHLYRLQLLAAARRRLSGGVVEGVQDLAVGFIDLVDFTAVSQELEPDELATMVSEFETRAYATVAEAGARVVKTIGDEVMFSTPSPLVAVSIALRLAGDERRGPLTPDVRAGVALGPVVARWGDAFGPVVNLASRLVNVANPGTVLVSDEVHDALESEEGLRWRELRPRRLKGIGRARLWRVRPA